MDSSRKKQLIEEYRNRKPEMGIIALHCLATDELFLSISKDIPASFNSLKAKLAFNSHPNKRIIELWNNYSPDNFNFYIEKKLKYDDPQKDQTKNLEKLLAETLKENKGAVLIWK